MNNRPRAFAAIIEKDCILMVHVVKGEKNYWTLPGGGLENEETFEEAVIREVQEEVNLKVKIIKHLYTNSYELGVEKCFLVQVVEENSTPILGFDPELLIEQQELKEIKWQPIKEMEEDIQVSKVIRALGLEVH
ncbi:NUDIX domain-containing protein [Bacillus sp. EAC]|uniref:NUDIX domain-containing protein n=1 Tax=Bacillus sp. EAC TaxID=1978338 RepID=UPI000B435899|nr:NUDIX hydrolase [Bacillus sp. EAC]